MDEMESGLSQIQEHAATMDARLEEEKNRHSSMETLVLLMTETLRHIEAWLDQVERPQERIPYRDPGWRERRPSDGSPTDNRRNHQHEQWRRVKILIFCGKDAYNWLDHIKQYFALRTVLEVEWISVAAYAVEGRALTWFRWWEPSTQFHSWLDFREEVLRRFQPEHLQNPYELLLQLKQEKSMREYKDNFEMYASPLRIVDRQFLIGIFLNGLKTEVSVECKLLPFHSLEYLMNLAEKVEGKNATLSRGFHKVQNRLGPSSSQWRAPPNNSSQVQPNTPKPEEFVGMGNKPRGPRHLSNVEYQEKRAKGLCFFCDEPFSPDHSCKNKSLKLMLMEGDALEMVEATNVEHQEDDTTLMVSEVEFKLSSSPNNHKLIRAWATIHGKRVRVLINCGASHNFVAPEIAQELGLEVDVGPQFVVKVADRKRV